MVFKQIKKLIEHETCRNGDHVQLEISEKFKRFLNKENIEIAWKNIKALLFIFK